MSYTEEEIRRRQSVSTLVWWCHRPISAETMAELFQRGLGRIELLESPEQFNLADPRSMRPLVRMIREQGLSIGAYHSQFVKFTNLETEAQVQKEIDRCKGQIETLVEAGGTVWGCHLAEWTPVAERCLLALADFVTEGEVSITVENFIRQPCWVEERVASLKRMGHPNLGMILDIGHVRDASGANPMARPGGPTEILNLCGPYLRHVHLHGFIGGVDHFPPLAENDTIQWRELFGGLQAIDYSGWFNFEPRGPHIHPSSLEAVQEAPSRLAMLLAEARPDQETR